MVKRAMVRVMRPTACSQLPRWRWSWAPRRHNQPEMAASGVMKRKHIMSQNSVLFSLKGPGSRSHCGGSRGVGEAGRSGSRGGPGRGAPLGYLCERARPPLHVELGVAQLAVAGVGGRQPPLQAALVHRAQRARAVARRQQALAADTAAALVANAADGAVAEPSGAVGTEKRWVRREIKGPRYCATRDFTLTSEYTSKTHCSLNGRASCGPASPLGARRFEHRGQQAPVQGRDLGEVQRLAPGAAALLHVLPRAVTQRAGQVATAPRRHGCGRIGWSREGREGHGRPRRRPVSSDLRRWSNAKVLKTDISIQRPVSILCCHRLTWRFPGWRWLGRGSCHASEKRSAVVRDKQPSALR